MKTIIQIQEMDEVHHELLKITLFVLEALRLILILVLDVLVVLNPIGIKLNE